MRRLAFVSSLALSSGKRPSVLRRACSPIRSTTWPQRAPTRLIATHSSAAESSSPPHSPSPNSASATAPLDVNDDSKSPGSNDSYGAEDIQVLQGLEPVRLRPGMYIGSTGPRGLHHLVYEVVDNAVDEALAGFCSRISITLHSNGSVTVHDDGRGIPVAVHPATGKSALETVVTVLHAGGKFGGSGYAVSGGLHGVGVSVVNALSEWLVVRVWRDDARHTMRFQRGIPDGGLSVERGEQGKGTEVTFMPDAQIFTTTSQFDAEILGQRLDEIAYLNPGLEILLKEELSPTYDRQISTDEDTPTFKDRLFRHDGGIKEFVDKLSSGNTALYTEAPTISFSGERNGVGVDVAVRWSSDSYSDKLIGFANNIRTPDGGTHLEGMRTALTRTVNQLARRSGKLKEGTGNIAGEFIREGLTAIVAVKVSNPEFEGQTKSRLGNPEVRSAVDNVVSPGLVDFFEFHPTALTLVVDKAFSAQAAAEAARRAREVVRKKSVLESTSLPGKLADCSSKDPFDSEIFIVEGESAGGSAKQARDREFQAILPLRGKILNIEKTDDARIYQNGEIQALISALGLGIRGDEFSPSQLRYNKVIIMTDADVDGAHIRTLLLTFFFRYQRAMIENGFVYIACPPLYKVERRGKSRFFYNDEECEEFVQSLSQGAKYTVQRFKGLGEMMPKQLWVTTMDPSQRTLKQVQIEDALLADQIFTTLMGDRVGPRREFIESHSSELNLSDIDY